MTTEATVEFIVGAATWDERVARMRQIPQRHGTDEHSEIYAAVAKRAYVPHLAPDYAYVHSAEFYTLGPVIRDCDGRVFSVGNLPDMLTVSPFPMLSRQV